VIIIAWIFGAKVIAHVRGSNFENFYRYVEPAFQRLIRFVIKRLTLVILLAERFRVQFRGLLPDDRIRVLYNAVDTHLFDDDKPRRLEDDITLTVLFIGHLSAAKGFLDVLKAAPQVLRAVPSLAFSFAGEWLEAEKNILYDEAGHRLEHDSKAIRQLWSELQHWYDGRLRYLGVLTRLEVVAVIKAAHIFVLPSYSEGFPMAVLEAMAGGLPMVVTPVGTLAEVLEDGVNCIFVSPGDVDALAKALIELANRPELRERIGQANRELVRIRFSMEAMAERLSSFFKECLA
jgi:glycosyltransferase involved in cell wall biosynthesis